VGATEKQRSCCPHRTCYPGYVHRPWDALTTRLLPITLILGSKNCTRLDIRNPHAHGLGMQSSEQLAEQSAEQKPERPWWQFKPGQSGNPAGRRGAKDRVRAEAERLTEEFARRYGRAPDAFEADTIGNAALLRERLSKCSPADDESLVRLTNARDRCLRRLGMGQPPSREVAADVPWPTNYKMGGGK